MRLHHSVSGLALALLLTLNGPANAGGKPSPQSRPRPEERAAQFARIKAQIAEKNAAATPRSSKLHREEPDLERRYRKTQRFLRLAIDRLAAQPAATAIQSYLEEAKALTDFIKAPSPRRDSRDHDRLARLSQGGSRNDLLASLYLKQSFTGGHTRTGSVHLSSALGEGARLGYLEYAFPEEAWSRNLQQTVERVKEVRLIPLSERRWLVREMKNDWHPQVLGVDTAFGWRPIPQQFETSYFLIGSQGDRRLVGQELREVGTAPSAYEQRLVEQLQRQ